MPRRSTAKRIDYSKFGASGSSSASDDDDFESVTPPPKKPKTTLKEKPKNEVKIKKSSKELNETRNSASSTTKVRVRNSRTSNAEIVYEQELLTALEMSKNEGLDSKNNINVKEGTVESLHVITLDDSDDEVIKLISKKKETSGTETNDSDGSAFADTLPVQESSSPKESEISEKTSDESPVRIPNQKDFKISNQRMEESNEENEISQSKKILTKTSLCCETLQHSRLENVGSVSRVMSPPQSAKSSPMVNNATSQQHSNNAKLNVLTPGRLRLGLSRNIRVSKPLHQNANKKML